MTDRHGDFLFVPHFSPVSGEDWRACTSVIGLVLGVVRQGQCSFTNTNCSCLLIQEPVGGRVVVYKSLVPAELFKNPLEEVEVDRDSIVVLVVVREL